MRFSYFEQRRARVSARDAVLMLAAAAAGAGLMYLLHPKGRLWARPQPVDDGVLAERVRAALGRVTGDPSGIDVRVRDGRVFLRGPVVPEEAAEFVACAGRVPGVRGVEDRLSVNIGM